MKIKKCVICNTEFSVKHGNKRKCCSNECTIISRAKTNIERYGQSTPYRNEDVKERLKNGYAQQAKILDELEIYSKEDTIDLLNSNLFNYNKYFGKSKNRTMICDDPRLYKSLIHWSDIIIGDLSIRKPLSLRLQIMGKYRGVIGHDLTCHCGKQLSFDPAQQDFTKRFCNTCKNNMISEEYFKNIYPFDWIDRYKIYTKDRYDSYFRIIEKGIFKAPIGKNEKELLDNQEIKDNCIIERCRRILNYLVDGYCEETNTVYEVYEYEHKYNKEKDKLRLKKIVDHLGCNVVILFDGWDGYDDWY